MVPQWCTQCAALHLLCLLQGVLKHRNRLQLERDNLKEEREKKQKVLSDPKVQANPQKHDKLSQEFTKVKCVGGWCMGVECVEGCKGETETIH